ncbi:MAG TPA: PQQ-binding-like beta-propeller repeat protein [Anaerolineaceae bacterium]
MNRYCTDKPQGDAAGNRDASRLPTFFHVVLSAALRLILAVGLILPLALAPGSARAVSAQSAPDPENWPMYMGGPTHAGRTAATTFTRGPQYLQWAYSFGERVEVEAQPVLVDDVIYQGVMNGEMHAINALTGKKIWIAKPGGPIAHTAAVADGRVFYGALDGKVWALDAATGKTAWSFATGGPVVSAPAVVDGLLYIGSTDGALYALDAASGALAWKVETDGPVISSPAVSDGRVYFGSEDMHARAADAQTGTLLWETPVYGQGMRNTHPVVSDDGGVVIFQTVKPGATSYVPAEGYPNVSPNANPVETWARFYQARPKYRTLYYFDAGSGADLWNPGSTSYVPLPIPYWGLLAPVIGPDGYAYLPAPAGSQGNAFELDHDNRLFRVDLSTGQTQQVAGGPNLPEFQTRMDEVGRAIFSGDDYLYTSSEDLSVYHADGSMEVLFGDGTPSSHFNIGSHMAPLSPLPSLHLWRYGGVVAMGGVPGASIPLVANSMIYYSSYGWLYAVGQTGKNLNAATSFPKRDARAYELTYPQAAALSTAQIRAEIAQRVADIIALGTDHPPVRARWEQPGGPMMNYDFTFEVYGLDYELVRALSEAYPYVDGELKTQLKDYLTEYVRKTLLDPRAYEYKRACLFYGEDFVRYGDECKGDGLASHWNNENPNLNLQRLYGLWAYATATGDWDSVKAAWQTVVMPLYRQYAASYNAKLGFLNFEEWRVGRLNLPAQIEGIQAIRDMAAKVGDTATKNGAKTLLGKLLNGRVNLANLVPKLYDTGKRKAAPLRLNKDGTIVYEDVMGPNSPYNSDMIPYSPKARNRTTDPSQVNWWDGANLRVDAGMGFMHLQALSQYYPMSAELAARLRARLASKTAYYVKSYEVNAPWWWMTDLAHHTTGSGEHLYNSPTLSWSMFQVKAKVQNTKFDVLVRQLPIATTFNAKYDLYRLHNLATLLQVCAAQKCKR